MFKAGEKVIHHRFGEGVLEENKGSQRDKYPIVFLTEDNCLLLRTDGRQEEEDLYPSIYYVPQTLDMSKPEPKVGTWGYFWDDVEHSCALFAELCEIDKERPLKYKRKGVVGLRGWFKNFSPEIPPHIKELMNGTDTSNP